MKHICMSTVRKQNHSTYDTPKHMNTSEFTIKEDVKENAKMFAFGDLPITYRSPSNFSTGIIMDTPNKLETLNSFENFVFHDQKIMGWDKSISSFRCLKVSILEETVEFDVL